MAIEQKWPAVAPQLFTGNGTQFGVIKIASASGFKVKQKVSISAVGQPTIQAQVKRVIGPDTVIVGPFPTTQQTNTMTARTDLTAYTVAASAYILAEEQDKAKLNPYDIWQAVYDQEPAVALRNVLVDEYGRYFATVTDADGNIRLAVDAAVSIGDLTVALDALSPPDQGNPDNVLIAGSEDGTKGGLKHAARVDAELDLRVGISDGANKAAVDATGRLSVIDADALSALNSIRAVLPAALGPQPMAGSISVTIAPDQAPIPVIATLGDEPLKISGTIDGQPNGTEFTFVNNLKLQILDSHDRIANFTYADFGTKNQRVTVIDYSSATFPGSTVRRVFAYTLVGNNYRRDSETWTIV